MTSNHLDPFGSLLRHFRQRSRQTQQELATSLGVHRNAISRWEQGEFLPASKSLVLEMIRLLRLNELEGRQLLEASLTGLSPHWLVPFLRNPFFTGREAILEQMWTCLRADTQRAHSQPASPLQMYALHGLGGIGKTHLAIEYAYRHALEYTAVFFIEAETNESIVSSLLRIATFLHLPERQDANQQRIISAVQHWLATHKEWLLIWDNLEQFNLLHNLLPPLRQGAILVTTRQQALGTLAQGIAVTTMEQEEGLLFLLRRAKVLSGEATREHLQQWAQDQPAESAAAVELVTILGGLPLALDQAGAYIEETGCTCSQYLSQYKQHSSLFLDRRGAMSVDHPHSVMATLQLSCERVAQSNPAALDLLQACAFLAPDAIPEELLVEGARHLGPVLEPVVANPIQFDQVLATLRSLSLIHRHPETQTFSLHRLVQQVLQENMDELERETWIRHLLSALDTVHPNTNTIDLNVDQQHWRKCARLLPHVLTCAAAIPDHTVDQQLAEVLQKTADYLFESAQYEQAEALYQRTIQIWELAPDSSRPDVARALYMLATIHFMQRGYNIAEDMYRRAILIWEQKQESDHLDASYPLSGLGSVCAEQHRYEEAEVLFKRVLAIRERALGFDHPQVAHALNNLTRLYSMLGRYAEAEKLSQRTLSVLERSQGPDHIDMASALNNLAAIYGLQSKYTEAKSLYQQVLHILKQNYGSDHPNVAYTLHELADLNRGHGEYAEAESHYQQALRIREQRLGPDHLLATKTRQSLTLLYQQQGKVSETPSPQEEDLAPVSEKDPLQEFLEDCCELHPRAWSRASDLWQAYLNWADEHQERFPLTRQAFTTHLKASGCRADRTKTARIWRGIALVNTEE